MTLWWQAPVPQGAQPTGSIIPVPELVFIAALMLFFAVWGWRNGLDAVIIAGLFVLFARFTVDLLAKPVASIVNVFYGIFQLFSTGRFSGNTLFAVLGGDPNVVKPLINTADPNDAVLKIMGSILFVLIAFIGFRYAKKKAGGKDTFIENAFGFFGGAALGYLALTFILDRHITFPQVILVEASQVPQIRVDAPLLVIIILVLIVFGIQRSKAPAKKKK